MPRIDLFDVTMQSWARLNPPQRKRFSMRARRRRCGSAGLSFAVGLLRRSPTARGRFFDAEII
jgi:hypothetical protein